MCVRGSTPHLCLIYNHLKLAKMKKVSFLYIVHFLTNLAWTRNEETKAIECGGEDNKPQPAYKSVGNKFSLSKTFLTHEGDIKDVNRNIFSTITGIIGKHLMNAKDIAAAVRSAAFPTANSADKLFNLLVVLTIDGKEVIYNLSGIQLGADSLMTAKNIYVEMIKAIAGEDETFDAFVKRQPDVAEQLAYMLAPFGLKLEDCVRNRQDVLTDTVSESVKVLRSYKKEAVKSYMITSGVAQLAKARKELKESNELAGSTAAAKGKQLIEESKVEAAAEATE